MKHTQGQWSVGVYETTITMVRQLTAGPQSCVCLVENGEPGMVIALCGDAHDEQSQRDADLIAASPELLSTLENILNALPDDLTNNPALVEAAIVAREAIAKARGEK